MKAIKSHNEGLEKDLHKLQAEVQVWGREKEDNERVLQALLEERPKCRELEEALYLKSAKQEETDVACEGKREVNEVLIRELDQEQRQRMELEEELKVSKVKEEHTLLALQDERAALENLKQHINTQKTKCKELDANACSSYPAQMMGTFGFFAPKYTMMGRASIKSGVFSFGVVLLELIRGQKPVDKSVPLGQKSLVV
ncbi:hypothetical protein L7F22_036015 [Adiantum nelumboides]|nr:hypothetical protein [Adiantum nelumboides]